MKASTYRTCTLIIGVLLAAFIAWSIISELPVVVPALGFAVGLLLVRICRRYTKELMEDERIHKINDKASSASYRTSTILMVAVAIVFISLKNNLPYELEIAGLTLSFTACALMLVHLGYYYFYKNQL